MTEKRFTVKQLIKYLADFNPNAVIMNNINPSWVTGMEEEEIRDIDNEKLNALNVWLFDDDEEAKRVIDLLGLNEDNLNEKARERSKALSKLQKENEQLKKDCTTLVYSNQDYRQENENLKKQLDYIQNLINEHIKHQKTELGQKSLREVIQDYNDWLLGHEEVKE